MILSKRIRISTLLVYFIILNILFCLPGSAFPQDSWLKQIGFDKWVHIGLMGLFSFLICWTYNIPQSSKLFFLFVITASYGLLIEIIQDQFIANRSFDWGDWYADMIGSIIGILLWRYIKK